MSDLIRREDVFEALGITNKSTKYGGDHSGYDTLMLYEIMGAVDSIPTAEPRVGKWVDHSDEGYVECPFCGSLTTCEDNIDELHYCFNCGAKMEGESDGVY